MTRPIKIIPILNGYVVECGCQVVVFDSRDKLLIALADYTAKPQETEERFLALALHKSKMPEPCAPTPVNTCCPESPLSSATRHH